MSSRLAAFAAALAAALSPAVPAGAQTGGATAPGTGAASEPVDPGFVLSARRAIFVGGTVRIAGSSPRAAGRTVRIDALGPGGVWVPVATAPAGAEGGFTAAWQPPASGRYTLRAVAGGDAVASQSDGGAPAHSSVPRRVTVLRPAVATWYGPGFYGRLTACGVPLTTRTVGVAPDAALRHARRDLPRRQDGRRTRDRPRAVCAWRELGPHVSRRAPLGGGGDHADRGHPYYPRSWVDVGIMGSQAVCFRQGARGRRNLQLPRHR